eukprot:g7283.t1
MSPQLQSEVSITLNWQWLLKVPFFREFIKVMDIKEQSGINTDPYRACIADIAHHMDSVAYAQQEMFGESQVLYILSKGLVVLNSRVALVGSVWGEDFVLADRELIRRTSAYALMLGPDGTTLRGLSEADRAAPLRPDGCAPRDFDAGFQVAASQLPTCELSKLCRRGPPGGGFFMFCGSGRKK